MFPGVVDFETNDNENSNSEAEDPVEDSATSKEGEEDQSLGHASLTLPMVIVSDYIIFASNPNPVDDHAIKGLRGVAFWIGMSGVLVQAAVNAAFYVHFVVSVVGSFDPWWLTVLAGWAIVAGLVMLVLAAFLLFSTLDMLRTPIWGYIDFSGTLTYVAFGFVWSPLVVEVLESYYLLSVGAISNDVVLVVLDIVSITPMTWFIAVGSFRKMMGCRCCTCG